MDNRPETPLLDTVNLPADLRKIDRDKLRQLADELRTEMIDAVGTTGGHLGSGLGVVELTVAIHYIFNTPEDRLIWDVGHQCYPHKILTGRRDRIRTLRQGGGLSGFTKRAESEYDPFGAAHSSTSISAALGFAVAALCVLRDRFRHERLVLEDGRLKRHQAKLGLLLLREELDARRIMAVGVVSRGPGEEGCALMIQNGAQDLVIFRGTPRPEQLRWVADTLGARLGCEG